MWAVWAEAGLDVSSSKSPACVSESPASCDTYAKLDKLGFLEVDPFSTFLTTPQLESKPGTPHVQSQITQLICWEVSPNPLLSTVIFGDAEMPASCLAKELRSNGCLKQSSFFKASGANTSGASDAVGRLQRVFLL